MWEARAGEQEAGGRPEVCARSDQGFCVVGLEGDLCIGRRRSGEGLASAAAGAGEGGEGGEEREGEGREERRGRGGREEEGGAGRAGEGVVESPCPATHQDAKSKPTPLPQHPLWNMHCKSITVRPPSFDLRFNQKQAIHAISVTQAGSISLSRLSRVLVATEKLHMEIYQHALNILPTEMNK